MFNFSLTPRAQRRARLVSAIGAQLRAKDKCGRIRTGVAARPMLSLSPLDDSRHRHHRFLLLHHLARLARSTFTRHREPIYSTTLSPRFSSSSRRDNPLPPRSLRRNFIFFSFASPPLPPPPSLTLFALFFFFLSESSSRHFARVLYLITSTSPSLFLLHLPRELRTPSFGNRFGMVARARARPHTHTRHTRTRTRTHAHCTASLVRL